MRNRLLKNRVVGAAAGMVLVLVALVVLPPRAPAGEIPRVRFTVTRFDVAGDNPLSQSVTHMVLAPYLGDHEGLAGLESAAAALDRTLKERGYAFHRVVIPPQKLKAGAVTLEIHTVNLDMVVVEGNRYFSADNILASLPALRSGRSLNTREIARSLQVANAHPAKKVAVFIRQGETPDTLVARVEARESRPYQLFSSAANTGDDSTGRMRVSVGAQHSNLFARDHTLTLSYTTSPEFPRDVSQMGAHYRLPIYPLAAGLSVFYSRSEIDQGRVADFFDVSGRGNFGGAAVDYTFFPSGTYSHQMNLGFQDRLFENDTLFGDADLGQDVRSRPLSLRYSGRIEKARGNGGFYVEYAANIPSGSGNDADAYRAARAGAEPEWFAIRYGADLDLDLPRRFRFKARLSGQATDAPLIPGEQFGLGGARSVRGFDEREVSGEQGQQISAEVWTPALWENLRLAGFMDAGWLRVADPAPGQAADAFISGTGLGLRWFWKNWLGLYLDAAYVLDGAGETETGDTKLHLNLFLRY